MDREISGSMIDLGALPIPDADGYFAFPDGRIWSSSEIDVSD